MIMNIAIVDDEKEQIDSLSALIKEYAALVKQDLSIHAFESGEGFIADYHPYAYTAIFMDIYMSGMSGVEAAEEILSKDRNAIIIFLTSSSDHMPEAFSLHVFDYIPKPAVKDRIFKVMDDILLRHTEIISTPKLTFSCDRKDVSIPYPDLVCIRTDARNYLEITDASGNQYLTRLTFSKAAQALKDVPFFLLINRGILVNMDHIVNMDENTCTVSNGLTLPLNVRYRRELQTVWENYELDSIRAERRKRRERK